jgi:t-SNARE complex subunit (syntaxin)
MSTAADNERISELTSGAFMSEGERVIESMLATADRLMQEAADIKAQTEVLAEQFRKHVGLFVKTTSTFVGRCQEAVEEQAKIRERFDLPPHPKSTEPDVQALIGKLNGKQ